MRRVGSLRAVAALLVPLSLGAAAVGLGARASRPSPGGTIVFASDRAKYDPGEIYSLAAGERPRDVSRSLASDYGLAVAPAGDRIAFWSGRSGTDRVYLARSDGSGVRLVAGAGGRLLARTPGSGGPLVFSSDGRRLYATSYDSPGAFLIDTRSATARSIPACLGIPRPSPGVTLVACGTNARTTVSDLAGHVRFTLLGGTPIWSSRGWLTVIPIPGVDRRSGATVVVDAAGRTRAHLAGLPLAWSPDGRRLVLRRDQTLWVAGPADFGRPRRLLQRWAGGALSFAPDSRSVSTTSASGPVVVPLAGGSPTRGLDYGTGSWSRDGRLAYAGYADAYRNSSRAGVKVTIYVTDVHGRNPRAVGRFPFDDHNYSELQWLPGGRRVLYLTGTSCGGDGLFAVPAGGGQARALTHDPRNLEAPAWSPDGSRIAVSVQRFSCHLGAGLPIHIATLAADGSDVRRVTGDGDAQAGSYDRFPSFSPDGSRLAFAHGTSGSASIQTAATDGAGGRRSLLPPRDAVSAEPAWSPDGSLIAYADGYAIKTVAPGGGTPRVIAKGLPPVSCGTGGLAWSPDGRELAIGRGAGIYLMTVGDPASLRLAIAVRCAGNPSFSPDGKRIAFDAQPPHPLGHQSAIMVANTDGTGVRTISTVPFRESVHPAWRPAS
jgi:Tol biopolymer transport system component